MDDAGPTEDVSAPTYDSERRRIDRNGHMSSEESTVRTKLPIDKRLDFTWTFVARLSVNSRGGWVENEDGAAYNMWWWAWAPEVPHQIKDIHHTCGAGGEHGWRAMDEGAEACTISMSSRVLCVRCELCSQALQVEVLGED